MTHFIFSQDLLCTVATVIVRIQFYIVVIAMNVTKEKWEPVMLRFGFDREFY